ncbi:MAG: hypothetical protein JO272_16630 [Pseudonocardiales bacterium]|nr:hypothetical protein [Pseudonocardiales bacterium]
MSERVEPNVSDVAAGQGADHVAALIAGRAPEAVRRRAALGLVVSGGRHEMSHDSGIMENSALSPE